MNYALLTFAFIALATPGPNNIMLMASGTNYGFRRTLPHLLGVLLGFSLMVLLVGIGVMQFLETYPSAQQALKVICAAYLFYLSYRLATASGENQSSQNSSRPLFFIEAALFQWVNPKAWTMALTAMSLYTSSNSFADVISTTFVFLVVGIPALVGWVLFGQKFRRYLHSPRRLKVFNRIMAALLLSTLIFMF